MISAIAKKNVILWQKIITLLGSLKITVICLACSALLVFFGTLYQIENGVWAAQQKIFRSFIITYSQVPICPGGYLIGSLFMVNLTCRFFFRFRICVQNLGIILIHLGLMLLILGELFTGLFSTETLLPIKVNETKNRSLEVRKSELAISSNGMEVIFPEKQLLSGSTLQNKTLPFTLHIKKIAPNAEVKENQITEKPVTYKDGELNYPTAWVEIRDGEKRLAMMLLSSFIEDEKIFRFGDKEYQLSIRPKHHNLLFNLKLLEFKHEKHPGTNIPKSFHSHVALYSDDGLPESKAVITMNHPLQYKGKTIYQSSFNDEESLSILQVVDNPGKAMPYLFSFLVVGGLIYEFCFKRKR